MTDLIFSHYQDLYERWARAVTSLVRGQWQLLDTQYRAGLDVLGALFPAPAAPPAAAPSSFPAADGAGDLERRALERVRQGLPPPREVYDVQNRGRIDWAEFPEWARPTDPEAFTGCGHEG